MTFRNFLRQPAPEETFGFAFRQASGDVSTRIRQLMSGLNRQLSLPYEWPQWDGRGQESWENPDIPSGYTYLAQFVAHDCVYSSIPTGGLSAVGVGIKNRRSAPLKLETVYGDGPDSFPSAYAAENVGHLTRNKLLLSRASFVTARERQCPFRDIGRAKPHGAETETLDGFTAALIPDPRNDVHAVAAQVTMLFHLLHNKIVSAIEDLFAHDNSMSEDVRRYRAYFIARFMCEKVHHAIVLNDLLPRILHQDVVRIYGAARQPFLDREPLDMLPLEFAHVFRFGHAMVRPFYVFNELNRHGERLTDMMLATSASRPWRMPLDETWMVQWSHFFEINGGKPNLSRRIGPEVSAGLFLAELFGPVDETMSFGLAYRDLLSSALVGLWSVSALAAELRKHRPGIANLSPFLVDDQARKAAIRDWLGRHQGATGLSGADIDDLAADPPLAFYVLFEAAHDMVGRRLGALGSFIVAETLYKALQDSAIPGRASVSEMQRAYQDATLVAFGRTDMSQALQACVPGIRSMTDLVKFVAPAHADADSIVPFI